MTTPQLAQLMRERAARDSGEALKARIARREGDRTQRIMDIIDAASSRLDAENAGPTKWPRSSLIKIGYFVLATAEKPGSEHRAIEFVRESLAE